MNVQSILLSPFTLCAYLAHSIFSILVRFHVALLTAVLNHEATQDALAKVLVRGMNNFLTQPDLDKKFQIMSETMSKNHEEAARNAGHEFPKLVGNFIQGMWDAKNENSNRGNQNANTGNNKKKKAKEHSSQRQELEENSEISRSSSCTSLSSQSTDGASIVERQEPRDYDDASDDITHHNLSSNNSNDENKAKPFLHFTYFWIQSFKKNSSSEKTSTTTTPIKNCNAAQPQLQQKPPSHKIVSQQRLSFPFSLLDS